MVTDVQKLNPLHWPQAHEVHIHRKVLANNAARYLSPDEQLRADRLIDPDKRNNFIASRSLLREIVGNYLGTNPQDLCFSVAEHGKPYLSTNTASNDRLYFNLSHSGSLFLLAIAADREVGIDVEQVRTDVPFPDMARLAFSQREQDELFNLPLHLKQGAFYRCWTRKEAYLKACGMGFTLQANLLDSGLLLDSPVTLFVGDNRTRWQLTDISVPDEYCAALAVKGLDPIVRYVD